MRCPKCGHEDIRGSKVNKFYWGHVLKHISDHTGHSTNELHEAFKAKFIHQEDLTILGEKVATTRKLSGQEFKDYVQRVEQFANELGIYLPAREYETA